MADVDDIKEHLMGREPLASIPDCVAAGADIDTAVTDDGSDHSR
ncbi:MAG: hypothetical protein NTY02_07995 [Acidobacteria bacterium]|nr:hypothetical protein [Acidobacteriota bacterium]